MHDALFFGIGTYKPVDARLPGADQGGIVPALEFLIGQTAHLYGLDLPAYPHIDLAGEKVLVLGGGDTAMDCVRTAVRQGAASVTCVYRRETSPLTARFTTTSPTRTLTMTLLLSISIQILLASLSRQPTAATPATLRTARLLVVKRSGVWPVPLPAHRATTPRYLILLVHRSSFHDEPLQDLVGESRKATPRLS